MNATQRRFESFRIGERAEYVRTVTEADVVLFAQVSGDDNAIHLDEAFAAGTRFGGRVAHGALSFGFLAASQTRLLGTGSSGSAHPYGSRRPCASATPW